MRMLVFHTIAILLVIVPTNSYRKGKKNFKNSCIMIMNVQQSATNFQKKDTQIKLNVLLTWITGTY